MSHHERMTPHERACQLADYDGIPNHVLLREILRSLLRTERSQMNVAEALSTLDTHTQAASAQIRSHLKALHDQIDGLTKQVSDLQNADLPPDVQAKVDALAASIDAIDVPEIPVNPTPTPTPTPTPDNPNPAPPPVPPVTPGPDTPVPPITPTNP